MEKRNICSIPRPSRSTLYSQAVCINVLRFLWIVTFIWGEVGIFYWSVSYCRWPAVDGLKNPGEPTSRVLLLSDTQVQHPALQTRNESWSTRFWRLFSDLNIKKSWHVTSRLKPNVIVFLGDMLANGRGAKDEKRYSEAARKFKSIFSINPGIPVYYVPGNNDIWLGEIAPLAKSIRGFYTKAFGPPSTTFNVRNHTFVILDAPGLVDEDYLRSGKGVTVSKWKPIPNGPIAFVKDLASNRENEETPNPAVLLSHIPLSRPEMANCGPLREKGTIRRNVGHGYQSMLGRQTTTFLLQTLKPIAVFSGDNRDYCEYTHTITDDAHSIREVTLKSFSPSSHIRKPGFQLLSITSPSSVSSPLQSTIADAPCFLPDQLKIYQSFYAPFALLSLVFLFVLNIRRIKPRSLSRRPLPIRTSSYSSLVSSQSVSGRTTPIHHHSPSMLSPFPGGRRAYHTAQLSRAALPIHFPIPESLFAGPGFVDEEDEDPMQPIQYAARCEGHQHYDDRDEEWSDLGGRGSEAGRDLEEVGYDFVGSERTASNEDATSLSSLGELGSPRIVSQFIPAPDIVGPLRKHVWSYSFVLGGRIRRITIRPPTVASLKNIFELLKGTERQKHRGNFLRGTLIDVLSVFWLPLLVWWLLAHFVS